MPVPPVRAEAYTFFVALTSQADTDIFQVNPTLAIGDVTVSTDGGALNNITTLPVVTPAGGKQVQVDLSIAEMTGDVIGVVFCDAAGAEWQDLYIEILTDSQEIGDIPTAAAITTAVWAAGARTLTSYGTLVADTATAVWAYATRTLSSFGTLAADVWASATRTLTQSAAQVAAVVDGSEIAVKSYTTWDIDLTGIGNIADRTALYFTAKDGPEDQPDSSAIVSVEETLGLLYIDGEAATAADGSITVTDAVAGDITILVSADVTGIGKRQGWYGIKKITATAVQVMAEGWFTIDAPSPRAIA